jgi:hypothetical protein
MHAIVGVVNGQALQVVEKILQKNSHCKLDEQGKRYTMNITVNSIRIKEGRHIALP